MPTCTLPPYIESQFPYAGTCLATYCTNNKDWANSVPRLEDKLLLSREQSYRLLLLYGTRKSICECECMCVWRGGIFLSMSFDQLLIMRPDKDHSVYSY